MSFYIVKGDLFEQQADAIVITASPKLELEGPLGEKAHEICGERLVSELEQIKAPTLSQCVITNTYNLPSKRLIHVVTPKWNGGNYNEEKYLEQSYKNCINKLEEFGFTSIAFPLLSGGTNGFFKNRAIEIATETLYKCASKNEDLDIKLVIYDVDTWEACRKLLKGFKIIDGKLSDNTKEFMETMSKERRGVSRWYKAGDENVLDDGVDYQDLSQRLDFLIKSMHKTKVECYEGVISKTAFDKIMKGGKTNKDTLISLGINIGLSEYDINQLLEPLGEKLDLDRDRDQIIVQGIWKYRDELGALRIDSINEELAAVGCNLLKTHTKKTNN